MAIQTLYTGKQGIDLVLSNIYKLLNEIEKMINKLALKTDLEDTNKVLEGHAHSSLITTGNLTAGSTKISVGGTGTGALIGAGASVDVVPGNIDHTALGNLNSASHTHLTAVNHTDLTDGGSTSLHSHANDHVAATVADSSTVDMSIAGQQISSETIGLTDTITFVE